jgi:SpoVK/Ycf46/Vps4 family AAA+-type ATPase
MANPLRDFFFGTATPKRTELVEAVEPRRSFDDVILPQSTRIALDHALTQIKKHDLIFHQWGLGERHATGRGLAFNFAGPPGTGKTICAEAIAHALSKNLLVVRYSEVESLWAGETGKNVSAVFRSAESQDAVLFFDEADAIASRRFASVTQGFQREANTVVNVLLKELEEFDGVVIFATNLAANFDPAFERRIRTHILFAMPGPQERAQIWKVQLHARKTPLADDVDFEELGKRYEVSGGDIKNAVLKAAQMATIEPGADAQKQIHQRHFIAGMEDVLASKKVMEQTLFEDGDGSHASALAGEWSRLSRNLDAVEREVSTLLERVAENERHIAALPGIIERFDDASRAAQATLRTELSERLDHLARQHESTLQALDGLKSQLKAGDEEHAVLRRELGEITTQIVAHQQEKETALARQVAVLNAWKTKWIVALALGVLALVVAAVAVLT